MQLKLVAIVCCNAFTVLLLRQAGIGTQKQFMVVSYQEVFLKNGNFRKAARRMREQWRQREKVYTTWDM